MGPSTDTRLSEFRLILFHAIAPFLLLIAGLYLLTTPSWYQNALVEFYYLVGINAYGERFMTMVGEFPYIVIGSALAWGVLGALRILLPHRAVY